MTTGFILRGLTLRGIDVKDAHVPFYRGLNVIAGPSDTGKSFIVECIDFALGSGSAPRPIAPAKKYTTILLDIETIDGTSYTLERGLHGGDLRVQREGHDTLTLAWKHDPKNPQTVSHLLLALCGFENQKVQTNQRGKTRPISFRDLAPLVIVDEESIITKRSPVLSGQYQDKPVEGSVFRLLLTGTDDSAVITKEDPKLLKGRWEGKSEVLASLLDRAREELTSRNIEGSLTDKQDQFSRAQSAFDAASSSLLSEQANVAAIEDRRHSAWTRLRQNESRSNVLTELQKRFELLQEQYTSDLRRLEAVAEAGFRLEQLAQGRCPVCGALPEHQPPDHRHDYVPPVEVAQASRAEAEKTLVLLNDLKTTLAATQAEIDELAGDRLEWQAAFDTSIAELSNELQPRLQAALRNMRRLQVALDALRPDLEAFGRVEEYERLLAEVSVSKPRQKRERAAPAVGAGDAEALSTQSELLLRDWRFPNLGRVVFSEETLDIVISGEPRGSHGKGVRAITHAAFNLALLAVCQREHMPFPAMLILDSPLVVYREPDPGEEQFPIGVKEAFYRSIAATFVDLQVVIFENDQPPDDIEGNPNVILFTGTHDGRWGFIPEDTA